MDWTDRLFGCFISVVILLFAMLALWGAVTMCDWLTYERRAFPAIAACQAKRSNYTRQMFSTRVVCVPWPTRQDTATVQIR